MHEALRPYDAAHFKEGTTTHNILRLPDNTPPELFQLYPHLFAANTGRPVTHEILPNTKNTHHYRISRFPSHVHVEASSRVAYYHALFQASTHPDLDISHAETMYEDTTLLLDLSRNGVYSTEYLKKIITQCALLGVNNVTLYMEFMEIEGIANSGELAASKGQLSPEEIRQLQQYAEELGVRLYPTIPTLSHLEKLLSLPSLTQFAQDSKQSTIRPITPTDLSDNTPVVKELLAPLIRQMMRNFSHTTMTTRLNIGCDEVEGITPEQYVQHVEAIVALCRQLADEEALPLPELYIWADYLPKLSEAQAERIVRIVRPIYWQYDRVFPDQITDELQAYPSVPLRGFATSTHHHNQLLAANDLARHNIRALHQVAVQHRVPELFITVWHDNLAEAPFISGVPTIAQAAALNWRYSESEMIQQLEALTGVSAEYLTAIQHLGTLANLGMYTHPVDCSFNPLTILAAKAPLQDLFTNEYIGRYDHLVEQALSAISDKPRTPFEHYTFQLLSYLRLKTKANRQLNNLYQLGIKDGTEYITELLNACHELEAAHVQIWLEEKKPHDIEMLRQKYAKQQRDIIQIGEQWQLWLQENRPIPTLAHTHIRRISNFPQSSRSLTTLMNA